MSLSNRENIIRSLVAAQFNGPEHLDEEAILTLIENAIRSVRFSASANATAITGAGRRSRLENLAEHLDAVQHEMREVLEKPGLLEPFAWALVDVAEAREKVHRERAEDHNRENANSVEAEDPMISNSWEDDGPYIDSDQLENDFKKCLRHIQILRAWTRCAAKLASGAVARHRPPKTSPIALLIVRLGPIYKRFTGRDPARTVNHYKGTGGPFARFVKTVADEMQLDTSEQQIADAVKQLKKHPEWFRVCEPYRYTAEVFGHLMGENSE